jgi:hypothetical protein
LHVNLNVAGRAYVRIDGVSDSLYDAAFDVARSPPNVCEAMKETKPRAAGFAWLGRTLTTLPHDVAGDSHTTVADVDVWPSDELLNVPLRATAEGTGQLLAPEHGQPLVGKSTARRRKFEVVL